MKIDSWYTYNTAKFKLTPCLEVNIKFLIFTMQDDLENC